MDAIHWGNHSKKRTGAFEIYSALIDCKNVLDTVFDAESYKFWVKQIEKVAKTITKKTGKKAKIREINHYFSDKAKWGEEMTGILFQDLPNSTDLLVENFYYRKRIQIVVYNKDIISKLQIRCIMLDLKELERRLDEALAKETSDSLEKWLLSQRKMDTEIENLYGCGSIEKLKTFSHSYCQIRTPINKFKNNSNGMSLEMSELKYAA